MSKKYRSCASLSLNTGGSACPVEWGKVKGAILVEHGHKLPANITVESLQEACHADRPNRIYPVGPFVEYAKNGGEAQVSAIGYGPSRYNGMSAQTDAFTMPKFDPMLNSNLMKCASKEWDVYFFDNDNLYGYDDGTDVLAGVPMSSVYPTSTMFATSGQASNMLINFAHFDTEDSQKHMNFVSLDGVSLIGKLQGLTECMLVEEGMSSKKYRIVEISGGYDRTPEFGETFAASISQLVTGASSAEYTGGLIHITGEGPIVPNAPSVLYKNDVKFIDIVKVVAATE